MNTVDWGKRVVVLVLAAAVVVAIAGGAATIKPDEGGAADPLALPEYQPDRVSVESIPAKGRITPDRSAVQGSGTVLIDDGHSNRFSRADIQPLVRGLTRVGYNVEFYKQGDLAAQLEDAKAFVVIDPGTEYKPGDISDIRKFTGQGGHLLIVAEPTRVRIGGGLFGSALVHRESAVTTLTSSYGMSVGTSYLYNQQNADANYKFITTELGRNVNIEGVNRTTMYTAAPVRAHGGTVLLRSRPHTFRSSTDATSGQYPVAVRQREVVLVGDKTFMGTSRYKVADNEDFIAYLVEFLASSDRQPGTPISGNTTESETGRPTPSATNTTRPSGNDSEGTYRTHQEERINP